MVFFALVAALFAGYGTAYLASEDVRYLTRAGFEETRILQSDSRSRLVADDATDPALRQTLGLVLQSRDYAARLGLEAKETYTSYSDVGRDTLLLVLQAAPKDCICPYTWKYPIVGRIPYKGFFDLGAAQREADRLAARDTTSTCGRPAPSRRWGGSRIRCSRPPSPATRSSWPRPSSTRSRITRST